MAVGRKIDIKKIRADRGWTQELLAENLHQPIETIKCWEAGHLTPNRKNIIDIHKLCGFNNI